MRRKKFLPFALPYITKDEIKEVVDTLKSNWLTTGPKVKEFEEKFKKYVDAKYTVAVNSATAGLHLSLVSLNLKKESKVITTPYTFCSTANVVLESGLELVLADIKEDYNINPIEIEKKIDKKVKVIIPVHFGGNPCDMDEICKLSDKNKIFIVEDAAHAFLAEYNGIKIGSIGNLTVFSFYATKNITTGEGGMVTTNNKKLKDKISILSLHGISKDAWKRYSEEGNWYYEVTHLGYKYNMMDIQAALGLAQLKKAYKLLKLRERIANIYTKEFKNIDGIKIPYTSLSSQKNKRNAFHLYVIRIDDKVLKIGRNRFIEELKKEKIGTSVHFIPIHLHPFYRKKFGFKPDDYPIATKLYQESLSLPIYPKMSDNDIYYVVEKVKQIAKKYKK
jgi:dTDP-4-amino-4,6-dideoxygalactose transaminase